MAEGGVSVIRGVSLEEQLSNCKFHAHLLDVVCTDAHLVHAADRVLLRVAASPHH